jgi:hypothetical protein
MLGWFFPYWNEGVISMRRYSMMLGLVVVLATTQVSFAQTNGPDELQRQVNPGVVAPYLGANLMERYNYHPYIPLYLNFDSQRFYYLEYQDRLERAAMFGHRWPSAKFGPEFQFQRIDNEYNRQVEVLERPHRFRTGGGLFFGRFRK